VIWGSFNDQSQFRHDPKKKTRCRPILVAPAQAGCISAEQAGMYLQFTGDAAIGLPILKTISIVG
jgi:hypothetical protein